MRELGFYLCVCYIVYVTFEVQLFLVFLCGGTQVEIALKVLPNISHPK